MFRRVAVPKHRQALRHADDEHGEMLGGELRILETQCAAFGVNPQNTCDPGQAATRKAFGEKSGIVTHARRFGEEQTDNGERLFTHRDIKHLRRKREETLLDIVRRRAKAPERADLFIPKLRDHSEEQSRLVGITRIEKPLATPDWREISSIDVPSQPRFQQQTLGRLQKLAMASLGLQARWSAAGPAPEFAAFKQSFLV